MMGARTVVIGVAIAIVACACVVRAAEEDLEIEADQWVSSEVSPSCATTDIAGVDYVAAFAAFCKSFGKVYRTDKHAYRMSVWKRHHNCIAAHNKLHAAGKVTYQLKPSPLSDRTAAEYRKLLGWKKRPAGKPVAPKKPAVKPAVKPAPKKPAAKPVAPKPAAKKPAAKAAVRHRFRQQHTLQAEAQSDAYSGKSLDWRTKIQWNVIGDQGQCGDCWAWAAGGLAEAAWVQAGNNLQRVSSQQINDCCTFPEMPSICGGCNGGNPAIGLTAIKNAGGFCSFASYPFTGVTSACKSCQPIVQLSTVTENQTPGAESNLFALLQNGPVAVAINADPTSFQNYGSGVYSDTSCSAAPDHAVICVGYGTDAGVDYWILRNQWASTWGENGYMRMKRGINLCQIASDWTTATSAAASSFNFANHPAVPPAPVNPPPVPASTTTCSVTFNGATSSGTCIDSGSCSDNGGQSVSGVCPGPQNIQCCLPAAPTGPVNPHPSGPVNPNAGGSGGQSGGQTITISGPVCTGSGHSGICVDTASCASVGGTPVPNLCQGAANIECCITN